MVYHVSLDRDISEVVQHCSISFNYNEKKIQWFKTPVKIHRYPSIKTINPSHNNIVYILYTKTPVDRPPSTFSKLLP